MSIYPPPLDTPSLPSPQKQPFAQVPLLLSAYNLTVNAEIYAIDLNKVSPSGPNSKANVMCARVVGFFLIHLHSNRAVLSDVPYLELSRQVVSPGQFGEDANKVVYELGAMYRDRLIRGCMSYIFYLLIIFNAFSSDDPQASLQPCFTAFV